MDAEAAREQAVIALRAVERPDRPLALLPSPPIEYEWCWLVKFNSVKAIRTGKLMDTLLTGPVVVPKDGAEPWIAPSSPPVESWLNQYAARHGLPLVPLPAEPDLFA